MIQTLGLSLIILTSILLLLIIHYTFYDHVFSTYWLLTLLIYIYIYLGSYHFYFIVDFSLPRCTSHFLQSHFSTFSQSRDNPLYHKSLFFAVLWIILCYASPLSTLYQTSRFHYICQCVCIQHVLKSSLKSSTNGISIYFEQFLEILHEIIHKPSHQPKPYFHPYEHISRLKLIFSLLWVYFLGFKQFYGTLRYLWYVC